MRWMSTLRKGMFWEDGQKQKYYGRDHVNVLAVSSTSTGQRQQTPDRRMWSADAVALSVDGWQRIMQLPYCKAHKIMCNMEANCRMFVFWETDFQGLSLCLMSRGPTWAWSSRAVTPAVQHKLIRVCIYEHDSQLVMRTWDWLTVTYQ